MELKSYWAIILRRFWIIALVVGVVGVYVAYQYYHLRNTAGALKTYQSNVTIRIGLQANPRTTNQNYGDYISASESLADEFTTGPILSSHDFTTQVYQQILADKNKIEQRYPDTDLTTLKADTLGSALNASRFHSIVTINATWSTPALSWAIATAAGEVSAAHMSNFLDYEIRDTTNEADPQNSIQPLASAKVVNKATDPVAINGPSSNRPTLLLVLLLVAFIIGLALAFLVEYLDDRVRSKDEIEQMLQLPIIGEVPRAPAVGKGRSRSSSTA